VRCYKVAAKDRGLIYREALDEALCFGWIDGVRRSADDQSFSARFTPRKSKSTWSAKPRKLTPRYQKKLRANERAWSFFRAQAPWYQRTSIFWVMEAKREETRVRRLDELISSSARGQAIKLLARAPR
jgi:uncharacterized protein YdeI (YjbR/CyaY-like superfamily)